MAPVDYDTVLTLDIMCNRLSNWTCFVHKSADCSIRQQQFHQLRLYCFYFTQETPDPNEPRGSIE